MKKILFALLCLFIFTGCMPNNDDTNSTTESSNQNWVTHFEDYLEKEEMNYKSKSSLDASLIGGVEGYRYELDNGYFDVYRFEDKNKLKEIDKNKKVIIDNKEYFAEVNDNYVIVSDNLSQDISDMFRNYRYGHK